MIVRQMSGKKTLFLFTNSQLTKDFENEKDIEVVVTSKKMFDKYQSHIRHTLHSKVKLVFVK
jgi:hypothetical protein